MVSRQKFFKTRHEISITEKSENLHVFKLSGLFRYFLKLVYTNVLTIFSLLSSHNQVFCYAWWAFYSFTLIFKAYIDSKYKSVSLYHTSLSSLLLSLSSYHCHCCCQYFCFSHYHCHTYSSSFSYFSIYFSSFSMQLDY